MWVDQVNNFEDLSYADDIMLPIPFGDSNRRETTPRRRLVSNFGDNVSKVHVGAIDKMEMVVGAYRQPGSDGGLNALAYTMVKGLLINLGQKESGNQFSTADIQFIGRVLTVMAYFEIPSTMGAARNNMKPTPNWRYSTHTGDFDGNNNGEGNTFYNELMGCTLDDEITQSAFFDKLETCLLLQAVSPRRYIIRKENKNYSNAGISAKILLMLNEVRL